MSCTECGEEIQGQCDCCKLVNGDESFKQVHFCNTCQAYICSKCEGKIFKRGVAAVLDKADKFFVYLEKLKNKLNG